MLEFTKDTNLIAAQLRGEDHIPMHPVPAKWKYKYGKPLCVAAVGETSPNEYVQVAQMVHGGYNIGFGRDGSSDW